MSRSIFGWDLPPGCTSADIDRAFGGGDPPPCCDACGVDPCDKPEKCEKYQLAIKESEEFNRLEAEAMAKDLGEIKEGDPNE